MFKSTGVIRSTPDDHFTAGPDCGVNTRAGRVRLSVLVGIQASVPGLYLPPVFKYVNCHRNPPQTIISVPVQTAVCNSRPTGRLQCSSLSKYPYSGSYFAPCLSTLLVECRPRQSFHCHVHTAV